ncbi:MAG: chromosome segregation protein SMC [Proteobacteria bacterium]|jgi:chromosome segregation protein|nr:chromosome segregation protein SMC [Pseudomonadota bacterium]MDA1301037.1 chromosome segregation protein SMC [Pseudomonadota bacterium]
MRLQAIKLAGFKSFVDPTTVPFPSNLCAVVGPNGCGKSNIIDAVRWVMGESSAKTLRGESMTDVIFNGSNTRKPVGQASIELLFDNAEGRLTGEYASYSEISIRRQVTRDGQSNYFLNSQRCRRKDITDIFLGTGLGPRSYSIIEQGMISQLIEAKPEDLRMYLEEAAGISRYKERRRETERRIRHTKDNLDRLSDLREELGRQLHHLERQAKAAERYTEYRAEERTVRAELQALRYQAISVQVSAKQDNINRLANEQEARVADVRRVDAETETERQALADISESLHEIQKRYYDFGTEIARIEDGIAYQNERAQQLRADLEEVNGGITKIESDLETDRRDLTALNEQLAGAAPDQARFQNLEASSGEHLVAAEGEMQAWQQNWDSFNHTAAEARKAGEVQQSRIEHLEQALNRQTTRLAALEKDIERLSGLTTAEEIQPLEAMQETQEEQLGRIQAEMAELGGKIEQQRTENVRGASELDRQRSTLQSTLGRRASLDALQQAALGQQDDDVVAWLESHGLASNPRLAERLSVDEDWVVAVETVLGDSLQAVCVPGVDAVGRILDDFNVGALRFIASAPGSAAAPQMLASKVRGDVNVSSLLAGIYVAADLGSALSIREGLKEGESVVTPEGVWIGFDWLRVTKSADPEASVIRRQVELDRLAIEVRDLQEDVQVRATQLESNVAALAQYESDRDALGRRLADQQRAYSETRAQLGAKRVQAEQIKTDIERAGQEIAVCEQAITEDRSRLSVARGELQSAMDQMEQHALRREQMITDRDALSGRLSKARSEAREHREAAHQLALKVQSLQSRVDSTNQAMARLSEQREALSMRRQSLQAALEDSLAPGERLAQELSENLAQRLQVENELTVARQRSEAVEHRIRDLGQQRAGFDDSLNQLRGQLEELRLQHQSLEVRRTTIAEQMAEQKSNLESVIANLPGEANEPEWEENLTRIGNRIQRLGAINLAAIDEFKVASERKSYLDAQNEDLESALNTLESAIRKIDVETRTRFKETFDRVNSKLQQLFPKLFGGGHAYLEMTGEDLLDTGVGLMARPPGKRNSSIHLLSGGEKALTAIALVFSIFSLNPAPFCLLDEVDAPLDDTNVGRYSEMVKEMSRTVQFIYITHNKIAMEMGEHLMGVTMHEPGVSRLVSVDVDEAVAMVAV